MKIYSEKKLFLAFLSAQHDKHAKVDVGKFHHVEHGHRLNFKHESGHVRQLLKNA